MKYLNLNIMGESGSIRIEQWFKDDGPLSNMSQLT